MYTLPSYPGGVCVPYDLLSPPKKGTRIFRSFIESIPARNPAVKRRKGEKKNVRYNIVVSAGKKIIKKISKYYTFTRTRIKKRFFILLYQT